MNQILDPLFARYRTRYFLQVALATLTLFAIFVMHDALSRPAIMTAVASSAFIVFVNPSAVMAQPRRLVGGHLVAIIVAGAFSVLLHDTPVSGWLDHGIPFDALAAVAVGSAMIAMAATNTEHAPAAGTVLGLVLSPWSLAVAALVMGSAAALAGIQSYARGSLGDLL